MHKLVRAIVFVLAMVIAFSSVVHADESLVSATAYIVMDAQTGEVLLEKNADSQMYPASTTKLMTLALAYGKLKDNLDDRIAVSESAANIPADSSAAWFQPGEIITLRDAMMATYLISANDGANVLLEWAYGSIDAGIEAMNEELAALGCGNSHFSNAHGYYDPNHHVSPRDMAKIVQWGLSVDGFQEFLGTVHYEMAGTREVPDGRVFNSENELVTGGNMTYSGTIGGKCGWTPQSGFTNVEIADVNGRVLISVVMNSEGEDLRYYDCINLFESAKSMLA